MRLATGFLMPAKSLNRRNLITIVSVTILVGTEILAAALAGAWALGGLFDLGREMTIGLTAAGLALGLWGVWKFARLAEKAEPVYDR